MELIKFGQFVGQADHSRPGNMIAIEHKLKIFRIYTFHRWRGISVKIWGEIDVNVDNGFFYFTAHVLYKKALRDIG